MTKKKEKKEKKNQRPFDIPDLSGRTFLVTGGNTGLGKETILSLAQHKPKRIFLTSRSEEKSLEAIKDIKAVAPEAEISFLKCDLSSFQSIQQAAEEFKRQSDRLDVLLCNAGVMSVDGVTKEGYEIIFGTNHMGHALLIHLLLPTLIRTANEPYSDVRIVILSSMANREAHGLHLESAKGNGFSSVQFHRYAQSKLANLLYATALSQKYPNISTVSVHPGVVRTDLIEKLGCFFRSFIYCTTFLMGERSVSPEVGAYNQTWACVIDKNQLVNGEYYHPVGKLPKDRTTLSKDPKLVEELWSWTQKELESFVSEESKEPTILQTDS